MAVEHLISLGHRNIGYVGGCRNEDRYTGYLDTLKQNHLDVIPEYVVESNQTEIEGFEAMEKLLKSEDCPTGIYCANDITAVGMLKCLRRCRNLYFTPSIIASDDIEEAQYSERGNGTFCAVSSSGPDEGRTQWCCEDGTVRKTSCEKQLFTCFGKFLE